MINFQILGVSPLGINSSSCCCSFIILHFQGKQILMTPVKEHQTLDGSHSFEIKVSNAPAKLDTTEKNKHSHSSLVFCNFAFNMLTLPREEGRHTMMASLWSLLGLAVSCYINMTPLSSLCPTFYPLVKDHPCSPHHTLSLSDALHGLSLFLIFWPPCKPIPRPFHLLPPTHLFTLSLLSLNPSLTL